MADTPERHNSFFISAGDATEGPFDLDALRAEVASGRIDSRYQVWDEAAGAWMPLSTLDDLLGHGAETPRAKRVRSPHVPLGPSPETPSGEGGRPFSFNALTPRATLPEGEASVGIVVPRASMVQRSPATYDHAPSSEPEEQKSVEDEDPPSAPLPRRRIYSPMSAGANALRPFAAAAKPPPGETLAPAVEEEPPPISVEPAMSRPAVWPFATVCVVLCLLALTALRIAGLVNFGYREHEENERIKGELNALKEKIAIEQRGLKKIMAEKAEYLERFAAAQVLVRNMRISVFASTRRQLQLGDRPGVDQRLFELDQLNKLVPEDDAERKIRRELTDTYFGGAPPAAAPSPPL